MWDSATSTHSRVQAAAGEGVAVELPESQHCSTGGSELLLRDIRAGRNGAAHAREILRKKRINVSITMNQTAPIIGDHQRILSYLPKAGRT